MSVAETPKHQPTLIGDNTIFYNVTRDHRIVVSSIFSRSFKMVSSCHLHDSRHRPLCFMCYEETAI